MINKEKLLIVSAISPFPKTSGGAVRIYNTIKYLSEQFELYLIFFIPQGSSLNEEEVSFLKEKTKFFTFFYQKPKKNYLSFINEFQPYWFSDWLNDELKIFLPKLINQYDIKNVQIDCTQLLYLYQYLPKNVNKIFAAYDVSTVSFWRRLFEVRNPFRLFIYFFRWIEIFLYEKYFLPEFDTIISMSENDKAILLNKFKVKKILIKPNGIESINFLRKNINKVINLGYIGSFNHPPNRTAIVYFLNQIAPLLEINKIKFRYYIAGDNNKDDIDKIIARSDLINKNVIVNMGRIRNVVDFYKKIDMLVAPIFSGSGTRIKILEALSFGVPVITSDIGREGININNSYLSIANNKNEFITEIKIISKNKSKVNKSEFIKLKKLIQQLLWLNIFKDYL